MTGPAFHQTPEFAALTADDLVTGEAVALDLPPASMAIRIVSTLFDVAVTIALLFVVLFVMTIATIPGGEALMWAAYVGSMILVFLVFPTATETLTHGRSLGKLITGLRTVRDDGGPITPTHALVRALIGFVEIYLFLGIPALISAMLSEKGKRIGDYAAGTYAVRDRVRLQLPAPPAMPPHLAGWAGGADVSSLPVGLTLAVRQFLGRVDQITEQSRELLGNQLVVQVEAYVSPPPPAGTTPRDYLSAVIATRRDRDLARLHREDSLRRRLTARR